MIWSRIRAIIWDPGALQLAGRFIILLGHIEHLPRFRAALEQDGWEAAAEYTTLSPAELEARVESLYHGSCELHDAVFGTNITERRDLR